MSSAAEARSFARLQQFVGQLLPSQSGLQATECAGTDLKALMSMKHAGPSFDTKSVVDLRETADYRNHKMKVYEEMKKDIYKVDLGWNKHEYREAIFKMFKAFSETGLVSVFMLRDEPAKFLAALNATSQHEFNLGAAIAIHYELFGMSVLKLGTKRHHDALLPGLDKVAFKGCFCMTEIEHGSNVRAIATTATYDPSTQEFVINTPHDGARKFWIGMSNLGGEITSVVFARLMLPTADGKLKDHGVHSLVVPLRKGGQTCQGITILDCGDKIGWHGVDNSCIHFNQVRIPRANLLDKFASVSAQGGYSSSIADEGKRFAATLAALVFGRIIYCTGPVSAVQLGMQVALRYSFQRKQFGPGEHEVPIIAYRAHQRKLLPIIAQTYALEFGCLHLVETFKVKGTSNEFHAMVSAIKAWAAEWSTDSLSLLRVACGGHGYAAYNRIGGLRVEYDNFQTAEGDCTVLRQQTARFLLDLLGKKKLDLLIGAANVEAATSPVALPKTDSEWHSPALHRQLFAARLVRLLGSAAGALHAAMKAAGKNGLAQWAAWNDAVPALNVAVDSYTHLVLLDQFQKKAESCADAKAKAVLTKLCSLYALSHIETDKGFLVAGLVSPKAVSAVNLQVNALCTELVGHALTLVDAWEIPDHIARAPLSLKNMDYVKNTMAVLKPHIN